MKYFKPTEYRCKGSECCGGVAVWLPVFQEKMDELREIHGAPIHINSGFRCHTHNTRVGGVTNSYHTKGLAADIRSRDMESLVEIARTLGFWVKPYYHGESLAWAHLDGRYFLGGDRVP